jgi:hypothetical protein
VQIHEFLKFLSKKATAATPRRDGEEKKTAATATAAAPLWTSLVQQCMFSHIILYH